MKKTLASKPEGVISIFKRLVTPSGFDASVFFHPNVCTDGWDEIG